MTAVYKHPTSATNDPIKIIQIGLEKRWRILKLFVVICPWKSDSISKWRLFEEAETNSAKAISKGPWTFLIFFRFSQ